MATNTQLKFRKVNSLPASLEKGTIYFEVSTQRICVAKSTTEYDAFGVGLKSATLTDGILTITRYDNTTVTVDFNDIASATSVTTALSNLNTTLSNKIDTIEASVGLSTDGAHVKTSGNYTSNATTVVGEIAALDAALKTLSDQVGDLGGTELDSIKEDIESLKTADTTTNNRIDELNLSTVSSTGKPIVSITQSKGVVSATTGTITATNVTVTDSAGNFDGTNVETVLAEIQQEWKAADTQIQSTITNVTNRVTTAEGEIDALQEQVALLSSATSFLGVSTTSITDKGTETPTISGSTVTPLNGAVVIYGNKEFIWSTNAWVELGDTTAVQNQLNTLSSTVGEHTTKIGALEEVTGSLDTTYVKVSTYNTDKTALNNKDAELEESIDGLGTQITTVSNSIDTKITEKLTTLAGTPKGDGTYVDVTVTQSGGKVTAVAVDDTALTTKLSGLDGSISTINASIQTINESIYWQEFE